MRAVSWIFVILLYVSVLMASAVSAVEATELFSFKSICKALFAMTPGAELIRGAQRSEPRNVGQVQIVYHPGNLYIVFDGRTYTFYSKILSRKEQRNEAIKQRIGVENFGTVTLNLSGKEHEALKKFFERNSNNRWPMTCVNGVCWALAQADAARVAYPFSEFPLGTFLYFRTLMGLERTLFTLGIQGGDFRVKSVSGPGSNALMKNPEFQILLLMLAGPVASYSQLLPEFIRNGGDVISILGLTILIGGRLGALERYFSRATFLGDDQSGALR